MYVYGLSYDLYEKWIESLVGIKNIDGFNFIIYSES